MSQRLGIAGITVLIVLAFITSIWLIRWHSIARPNRERLKAAIDVARARFRSETERDLDTDAEVAHLKKLLELAVVPLGACPRKAPEGHALA
jgi:hypothetical protein